jgi:aerobic carbon-monoxide dehydrogenase large subunit
VRLVNQRIVMAPMEPRGGLAFYDLAADRYVLHCASQSAFAMRQHVARTMGVPAEKLRVVSGDVGGAFGMRASGYPEYPAMLLAAKLLGRKVRWRSTRQEGFVSDNQARDTIIEGRLALDAGGKFIALDIDSWAALGAYQTSHGAFIATVNFARCLPCMYDIEKIGLRIRCLFTNTVPTGPYRGAGRPEANYCLERLVDEAARVSGIDRIELRRRNLIAPSRMPYNTAVGTTYDSGEFELVFDEALARADVAGFAARKAASEAAGRRRGLGVACFLEIAGGQPGEGASVGFPGSSKLLLAIGVQASGQGHRTVYRRLVAERLGIPAEAIEVTYGDSDDEVPSAGAVASRSTMSVGGAVATALDAVIEKGRRVAAHVLEAAAEDIQYRDGIFEIAGTDRNIALFELADRARMIGESLDTRSSFDAVPSFPNGVHVAEVEIDPGTGRTTLVAYTCVDDCGRVLQPVLVEGQVQGGVAQGVGQALLENAIYNEDGQLLSGSFMDYTMPRADNVPNIKVATEVTLCTHNPLGVKGCGEVGAIGSPPAVIGAIVDALRDYGVRHIDMPATGPKLWSIIQSGRPAMAAE